MDLTINIVTVVYNDLDGLKATYSSLIEQNFKEYNWIVIDNDSIDGAQKFMESINDVSGPNVQYVRERDEGIYDAMNKGIRCADSGYILFLNAGDVLYDNNVLLYMDYLIQELGEDSVIYGDNVLVFGNGIELYKKSRMPEYIKHSLPTSHQAIFYPVSFLRSNEYDLQFKISGDYYITALAYSNGLKFIKSDLCISKFFVGGASSLNRDELSRDMLKVQADVLGLSLIYRYVSFLKRRFNMLMVDVIYFLSKNMSFNRK